MQTQKVSKVQQICADTSQFTPVKVHNNTSSLYPLDISSKTQVAFLIANEYCVHLWSDVHSYIVMELPRML